MSLIREIKKLLHFHINSIQLNSTPTKTFTSNNEHHQQ